MNFRRSSSPRVPRTPGRRFIICCEGEGEEGYLDQVRVSLRLPKDRIIITADCGTDPLSIVTEADNLRSAQQRERAWETGDTAWAVFDGDEHFQRDKENWDQAIAYAQRKGVKIVISNPSLGLWYLLHFQEQGGNIHRDHVKRALQQHVPDYDKKLDKIEQLYQKLIPGQTEAMRRARELAARHERDGVVWYTNPSTQFCDLIEALRQSTPPALAGLG